MFLTHLENHRTRQKELQRQAAEYRLARSLARPTSRAAGVCQSLGKKLIAAGGELIEKSRLSTEPGINGEEIFRRAA